MSHQHPTKATSASHWDERYQNGETPWDTGVPSRELVRLVESRTVAPGRALELGCGTGTNAVYLAQHGFEVTALDISAVAVRAARLRAESHSVAIEFVLADICTWNPSVEPFDFVFDRGCYHTVRRDNLPGLLRTLERITRPGSRYLVLAGNAREPATMGPPRVHEHELRAELGDLFRVDSLVEFRFEDPGGSPGPLGWCCLGTRTEGEVPGPTVPTS